jgi:hypothetical protein
MPGKTTDEKLVEAVANLGERVYALTFNVIELNRGGHFKCRGRLRTPVLVHFSLTHKRL